MLCCKVYSGLLLSFIRYAMPASVAADANMDNPKCIFLNVDFLLVLMICLPFFNCSQYLLRPLNFHSALDM